VTRLDRRRLLAAGAGFLGGHRRSAIAQDDVPPIRVLGWGHFFTPAITHRFQEATGYRIEVTPIGTPDDVGLFLRASWCR
jgi:hypothetical protein